MSITTTNVWKNIAMITRTALEGVHNNTEMGRRVARRWDGDFKGSGRIGNTLSIRKPAVFKTRTGPVAQPNGYVDTYSQVQLNQVGVDMEITSAELSLNVDDFSSNVLDNLVLALVQKFDLDILAATSCATSVDGRGFNQFAGSVGTSISTMSPFLQAKSFMETQSAAPFDNKVSAMFNPFVAANTIMGQTGYFHPGDVISENYKKGDLGDLAGLHVFTSSNTPAITLGTWSGTIVYSSGATDGGNTITVSGMTGTFAPGEHFSINGVQAVNPQGFAVQPELKEFEVVSQSGSVITFFPSMNLTGTYQNVNALPTGSAAIYAWGSGNATAAAASALSAGTGQTVRRSLVFHEDSLALCIADLEDVNDGGGYSKRMKDDKTGLRIRSTIWYDGLNDKKIFRLDALYGAAVLREGFGADVVQ
jgi:hypothetical protein